MITKIEAIKSLRHNAEFAICNDEIVWHDQKQIKPTDAEIDAEIFRLQSKYEFAEYQRKRACEYPPITDYIDGVVKGDQAQINKYIADCLTVKAKYPKPTVE